MVEASSSPWLTTRPIRPNLHCRMQFDSRSPHVGCQEPRRSRETANKAERLRATMQAKPLMEMEATALTLAIAHHVVPLGKLEVSPFGERTDYRSSRFSCMLELGGDRVPG